MKQRRMNAFMICIMLLVGLGGCIKDEPLNMEADIISAKLNKNISLLDPVISNKQVVFYLKPNTTDTTDLSFDFELTPGASIQLIRDSLQLSGNDTSKAIVSQLLKGKNVYYKVISQDKQYSKEYAVKFVKTDGGLVASEYGFETFYLDKTPSFTNPNNPLNYTVFYDQIDTAKFYNWSSGNVSFSLTLQIGGKPLISEAYPTTTTTDAHTGSSALLLETKATGEFGAAFKKPIAAGNLFIGSFDSDAALMDPLGATHFGLPFNQIPMTLEGYYKYTAGTEVTDKDLKVLDMKDSCDIYAVLYNRKKLQTTGEHISYLTGKNIFTDPSIVAIARLENGASTPGNEYVKFSIPFVYNGAIDKIGVANLDYNIAIVMSSSKYGDSFIGAIGSKLIVDDLKIITEEEQ